MATSSDSQLDALVEAADKRWQDDSLTVARASSWGFYAYGDASPAIGGGLGAFCWFGSKAAMLKFIVEVLPYSPPGPSSSDPLAVAEIVRQVTVAIRAGDIDLEKARKKLNKALRSYSQLEWMGTFRDLQSGSGTYARKIIKDFRRAHDLPAMAKPVQVTRSQLPDFKIFISEFGI